MNVLNEYENCRLCARECGKNRTKGETGACGMPDRIYVARASLHEWEEPIISGTRGSGTIFFSGCSLGCVYCQNRDISRGKAGQEITLERLSEIMLELCERGAHNINLVTPTHYAPSVVLATKMARERGLSVPIVYNTSSYETVDTLRMLRGSVDIYLADYKYHRERSAEELSFARNYPKTARAAISEMVSQCGSPVVRNGIMQSGVIVRILLLPSRVAEAKLALKYIYETYGDSVYISLMSQYTPMSGMTGALSRRVTNEEYLEFVNYAIKKGVKNAFIQEGAAASESFIPAFDLSGV